MDPNNPNQAVSDELFDQVKKAWAKGDKRLASLLINDILKINFTHTGAWRFLYSQYGKPNSSETLEEFQQRFTRQHFPSQAHLLQSPFPTPEPALKTPPLELAKASPPPQAAPPPAHAEMRFCPHCGLARTNSSLFCGQCGFQFAQVVSVPQSPVAEAFTPTAQPAPVRSVLPQTALSAYPVITRHAKPSLYTPKRIITALGLFVIILAGVFNWSVYTHFYLLGPNEVNISVGLVTPAGMLTTAAGLLGLILLFTVHGETFSQLCCVALAGAAAFVAYGFTQTDWRPLIGSAARTNMGIGPYVVWLGAAIVLIGIFIPAQSSD